MKNHKNQQKINKFKEFSKNFVNHFRVKFTDIDGQKVVKKFPWWTLVGWIVGIIIFTVMMYEVRPDFGNFKIFWEYIGKFFETNKDANIASAKITPNETFIKSLSLLWKTVTYSILGTIFGIIASIPIALLSSKNFIRSPWIYTPMRMIMSVIRTVPPLVYAFIFFFVFSSDLAATISVAFFVASLMAKWLYEDMDTYDMNAYYGMLAIGNTKFNAFKKSILPYLSKRISSYGFYSFEMVVRFAAILSAVGITTIGQLLSDNYATPDNYSHLSIVLWVLITFMIVIEFLNYLLKKYVLEPKPKSSQIDKSKTYNEQLKQLKKQKPKRIYLIITVWVCVAILIIVSLFQIDYSIANPIKLKMFKKGLQRLFQPDWSLYAEWDNGVNPINLGLTALSISVLSAFLGTIIAVIFGILASKKITGFFISKVFKLIIIVLRAIPPFTFALLFLNIQLNSIEWAGMLALVFHSVGMLGKLVNESVDKIDDKVFESLDAVGCNWYDKIRYGVIKQIMPQTLSNFLYRIEINFKTTVAIGVVGASAFGFQVVTYSSDINYWEQLSSYLFFTMILLLVLEQISNILRKKIMTGYFLKQDAFAKQITNMRKKSRALAIAITNKARYKTGYKNVEYAIAKWNEIDIKFANKEIYKNSLNSINKKLTSLFWGAFKDSLRYTSKKQCWRLFTRLKNALKVSFNKVDEYFDSYNNKVLNYETTI
ncbi:Phosphate-import permease protein phnE [Mycoplasmopsis californica]|uniref:ABC transporter permease subunit n=1 Tax=Mycoplasmopsis equigenitalium TaxID=114883 RepID=A0ABY5J0W6_9BACT|nr:ABC transporter permease subunit [Mycoplasmopsis equigenitalium]UUD36901.1 ABC transporter permease subunit [Mycoplasmopsis equigenitalium]VEU69804.1 Phosphate-import permease protein phnE [Mycoplasmopsis californica]